jgi:hypothetical protein
MAAGGRGFDTQILSQIYAWAAFRALRARALWFVF